MPTEPSQLRRALVTGASTGLGAAFADALAREGTDLVVVARDAARLEALASQLGRDHGADVRVLPADLTNPIDLGRVVDAVTADEQLDLLVNNAGFGTAGDFVDLDPDAEEREIRLNVLALVRLTRAALPGMIRRRRGAIINVSSMAAFQPAPYNATYGATKAYVNSFTEALAEEVRGTGVRVQALCPGFTRTEFQVRAGIDASSVPALAWMEPREVVAESLAALRRGGVVVVPGFANRATTTLTSILPRRLLTRALGASAKRLLRPRT
jgi:short-subunit dehydrogenase